MFMGIPIISEASVRTHAIKSLEDNIIVLSQGEFLAAGSNQFGSLWTRDFCFSVPALLTLKKFNLVKNHLNYLIKNRREDGLVPIYADSINPMFRVVSASIGHAIGKTIKFKMTSKIKPYYMATGKFPTIDANILVLLASFEYYKASGDEAWWTGNQKALKEIYEYYIPFLDDGLISQGAYSDWQDSSSRVGKTFFMNLLYLEVSKSFEYLSTHELEELTQKIHNTFYDKKTGLYFSILGSSFISIDGVLWALEKKLMPFSELLYERLKQHALWSKYSTPGFNTYPSYPKNWIAPHAKISGLSEYHGNLTWLWIMAFSSKVAYLYADFQEGSRISTTLKQMVLRDNNVREVYYSTSPHLPFRSKLYKSEAPFSWGAAFVIEMLKTEDAIP